MICFSKTVSFYLFLFVLLPRKVHLARILGVFPITSISHQVVFRPLTQELAKRGHELVIITPNPAFPKDRPPDNITEIDVGFSYNIVEKYVLELGIFKRGVIADVNTVTKDLYMPFLYAIREQINYPEVKRLIEDKSQHFDLVIAEAYFSMHLIFGKIFNAPVIQFSSFHGLPENYETVGALGSHPLFYPNFNRNKFRDLSFLDKIYEVYLEIKLRYEFWKLAEEENRLLKEQFGPNAPTINELKENVKMLFINTHPIYEDNRPVTPGVLYLGAFHLQPVKDIPEDLKQYLDNSKRGVVYVSLGSNVLPSRMDKDFLDTFLDAFESLPYDILWKFDGDNLERISDNVKMQKWFPQRDMLNHPNIKVFVTQGGLQSTDEAIDAAVPLVGIPILGDQYYNVNKYMELGIGIQLDAMVITADQLVDAVNTIMKNDSYKRNIERLRTIIRDQPQQPLERAVWWTEHVIRLGGARHLRSPAANMSWREYLMLDVALFIISIFTILMLLICKCLSKLISLFGTRSSDKNNKVKVN